MTHDNKRYPHAEALRVAQQLVEILSPFCERIEIAGSLRRQKPTVGDIEILYIGKRATRQVDLLSTEEYDDCAEHIDRLLKAGLLAKRPNKNGVFAWGEKNKLGIHVATGIPVDFFSTDAACWFNALVVRTGGRENNLLITTTAQKKGFRFEAYGSGFLTRDGYHQTTSERDLYEFLGLPYLEPKDRK